MARRRLRSLTIEGLTSIRSATVELGDVNVLIGPNGAGKSNFVSALAMLGRIADGELGLFVGLNGGAFDLMHQGPATSTNIGLGVTIVDVPEPNAFGTTWLAYRATLMEASGDRLIFAGEEVKRPGSSLGTWHRLSVKGGHGESVLSDALHFEASDSEGPFSDGEILETISEVLRGCRVFHFHDTGLNAPMKRIGYVADNITLHPDAGNLAAVLLRLKRSEHGVYQQIVRNIKTIAPFFRDFVLIEQDERVQLRWSQEGSDRVFPASAMSDGTLRNICRVTLLHLPELPGIVVLDEPELGLHPHAIVHLAEMLYASRQRTQVIVATQSVTLIDQFDPADLIIVERQDGSSTFNRVHPGELQTWLEDYSMGELWQKNLIGGNPRRERGGT